MKKIVFLLILALLGGYALLLAKPELYFDKSADYGIFTLRARGELPASPEAVLNSAGDRISGSDIYTPGQRFELILTSGPWEYRLFTPFLKGDFFRVNPYNAAVFLAPGADFAGDKAVTASGYLRSLSGVVTAAAAWVMTLRKVLPLTYLTMGDWELRGYAELLSGGTGEFNPSDACAGGDRPGLEDYKDGLMLDRLLKEENLVYNDLLLRGASEEDAERRFRRNYCGG